MRNFIKRYKIFIFLYESIMKRRNKLCYKISSYKWRERRVSLESENPDKTFYVIRRRNAETVGLFSYFFTIIGVMNYAIERGYIPIVDMQTHANIYLDDNCIKKVNAWEYYFEQPCGYGLKDIAKSKNIILGGGDKHKETGYPGYRMACDQVEREKWEKIIACYIKIRADLRCEIELLYKNWFGNEKVLGCHYRGSDYVNLKPSGHPIQPSVGMMIEKVKEIFDKNGYKYIYLATEDEEAYQEFRKQFGSSLFVSTARRYCSEEYGNEVITVCQSYQEQNRYLAGKEYLKDILMLANCNGLVTGCCGGGYGALLLKQSKYEDEYIFTLGTYS